MAVQVKIDEMDGCPGYLEWLVHKTGKISEESAVEIEKNGKDIPQSGLGKEHNAPQRRPYGELCRVLFGVDFRCSEETAAGKEDEIRATDAMELRRRYAEETGDFLGKSEREIDRIWKSVHGKCSVLELILQLAIQIDRMVNEDEPEAMVPDLFWILIRNLGVDLLENEDEIRAKLDVFMDRKYGSDGVGGGLFPLKRIPKTGAKDQREVGIWYQMNAWLSEHLDDEEHFRMSDFE